MLGLDQFVIDVLQYRGEKFVFVAKVVVDQAFVALSLFGNIFTVAPA